ncbi:MAG TPA: amino acid adenylation domain-containing protein [Actinocatenispora sp.]
MDEYAFAVSAEQQRLLVLDRLHPGSTQYHVPVAFRVAGPFDAAVFGRALSAVVARHEALRTTFRPAPGGGYVQVVAAAATVEPTTVRGVGPDALAATLAELAGRPFDLARGPLLRCAVVELTDGTRAVLLVAHHIVCDGWSLAVLLTDLAEAYREPDSLVPPEIQYPDYADWQRERLAAGAYDEAVAHWRDRLRGAPDTLELPYDRPRPAVQSTAADSTRFVLDPAALAEVAAAHRTTPFTVLFAAYAVFLRRLSGQGDLVIGVPVAGRDRADVHDMVGMLANTIAVRVDATGEPGFADLLTRVRDELAAGRPYQDAPFGAVVDALAPARALSHDPVVQVAFAYDDDTEPRLDLPGATVTRLDVALDAAKFDLLLYVERAGDDLTARLIHRTDLLDPATVRRWADAFRVLLAGLLAAPAAAITAPPLVDAAERHRLVHDGNRTAAPAAGLVPDLVAERAAERPDAVALVCGDAVLTYRELLARADRFAARLRAAGVGPEVPVGVCLPRSADMAVAALAVLRAGGAYLPLDPDQPVVRLRALLADARAHLVLTAPDGPGRRDPHGGGGDRPGDPRDELGVPVGVVDGDTIDVPDVAAGPGGVVGPDTLAYLLFTSGSTGTPKAVAVEHRALTNLAVAVRPGFRVTADDRVLQYVSFGFDVAVSDLFFAWTAGAELHVATADERLGDALHDRLAAARITYVFLPPAAGMSLPTRPLPDLRTLAVGGEPCPPELVDRWAGDDRLILDAYGPSESTVYATTAVLRPGEPVRIGRPVPNVRAYLLDERLRPVPVGVVGEIWLAGDSLARGYAHRPALTAERFVADPFGPPGSRMYRTGDLGRHDDAGVLSYLGRSDTQVKVRGFRVELGEVETVLAGHPAVTAAAATVVGDPLDRRLAAYVVGAATPSPAELRGWLAERLPAYLVPDAIVRLDALPTGSSGKLDRAALPAPPAERPELAAPYAAPETPTQHRIAAIWRDVLGLARVGVHDTFFDLGGNSVRLLAVLAALREQDLGAGLGLVDLFRRPTVAALAAHLDGAGADDLDEAARRGRDRRARLAARAVPAPAAGSARTAKGS